MLVIERKEEVLYALLVVCFMLVQARWFHPHVRESAHVFGVVTIVLGLLLKLSV